jgi:hypothetical protein
MQLKERVKTLSIEYEKLKAIIQKALDKCDSVDEFSLKSAHRDLRIACEVLKFYFFKLSHYHYYIIFQITIRNSMI